MAAPRRLGRRGCSSTLTWSTDVRSPPLLGRGRLRARRCPRPEELLAAELLPHDPLRAAAAPPAANGARAPAAGAAAVGVGGRARERRQRSGARESRWRARSSQAWAGRRRRAARRRAAAATTRPSARWRRPRLLSLAFVSVHGISVATFTRLLREQLGSAIVGDPKAINGARRTYASEVDAAAALRFGGDAGGGGVMKNAQRRAWKQVSWRTASTASCTRARGRRRAPWMRGGAASRARRRCRRPRTTSRYSSTSLGSSVTVKGDAAAPPSSRRRSASAARSTPSSSPHRHVWRHLVQQAAHQGLDFRPPCECDERALKYHNGHPVVQPKSPPLAVDPSTPEGRRNASLHWAENVPGKVPGACPTGPSCSGSGWCRRTRRAAGRRPHRRSTLQQYVMLAAKLAASVPLAGTSAT